MNNDNLKNKSVRAVLWSALEAVFKNGLQFLVSVILARLILPEEFGTIALLYLFTGLTAVFIDSGFSSALVQRQKASYVDECTVFWLNITLGITASALLWMTSPLIAQFYDKPILINLTKILALSLLINSIGSIHNTLFAKSLNFKKLTIINASATGVAGIVAIGLAINGFGVWALAAQTLTASVVTTSALWLFSKWRPSLIFSKKSMESLFAFGSFLMLSSILDSVYMRLYTILLGKFYGVRELAFYSRADRTQLLPVQILSSVLARVSYPIFSATSDDKERLRRGVRLALEGMMLINIPVMMGLMVTADSFVPVVFGDNWKPSVPILQVLCIAGVLWPVHVVNLNILKAQGLSNLFFRLEIIKKIVGTALLFAGLPWGMMGIAWSQVANGIFSFIVNSHYTRKNINYGALHQFIDVLPTLGIGISMSVSLLILKTYVELTDAYLLAVQVLAGVTIYITLCYLFKIKAFKQTLELLKNRK